MAVNYEDCDIGDTDNHEKIIRPLYDCNAPISGLKHTKRRLETVLNDPITAIRQILKAEAYACDSSREIAAANHNAINDFLLEEEKEFVHVISQDEAQNFINQWIEFFRLPSKLPDGRDLQEMLFPSFEALIDAIKSANPWWLYEMYAIADQGGDISRKEPSDKYNYDIDLAEYSAVQLEMKKHIEVLASIID